MESIPSQDRDRNDGPKIIRPIPRRPFELNFTNATPPEEDSTPPTPNISANDLRFLDPRYQGPNLSAFEDSSNHSLSRTASYMNLTSSALYGFYAPTASGRDRLDDKDEPSTPWGTGAFTPARRSGLDEATYELMRQRSGSMNGRRPSFGQVDTRSETEESEPAPASMASLSLRAVLLFALGMGYGVLVTRLPSKQNLSAFGVEDMLEAGLDRRYLVLWGITGVALGWLLPWFDKVWEETFTMASKPTSSKNTSTEKQSEADTDWALVVRGIGAFVGIVFAIRRTPWASTLQVSIALALANPFLWYLIDRSKPGFLLSAAVSVVGSAVLIGISPNVMPPPAGLTFASSWNINATGGPQQQGHSGLAGQDTIETAIWMLSVLFCSCVCFGNIGRRLALNRSAATRGRWAGIR